MIYKEIYLSRIVCQTLQCCYQTCKLKRIKAYLKRCFCTTPPKYRRPPWRKLFAKMDQVQCFSRKVFHVRRNNETVAYVTAEDSDYCKSLWDQVHTSVHTDCPYYQSGRNTHIQRQFFGGTAEENAP